MKYNIDIMLDGVRTSWKKFINEEIKKDYFNIILEKLNKEDKLVFPFPENVFETFKYCKLKKIKCVILGQDPYINHQIIEDKIIPQAMGMSFSVPESVKIPPSLKNIYKELEESIDEFKAPKHGNLSRWVQEEKIILLNASLTVIEKKSNSHAKLWKPFTDNLIKYISDNTENVVFILWGNFAKSKASLIDMTKHKIISGVHPSPLSANYKLRGTNKSFFGNNHFIKVNNYLEKNKIKKINWSLT